MEEITYNYKNLNPFNVTFKYHNADKVSKNDIIDSHIHDQCEIYVNVSGNVSFMVEGNLYPISYGNVIITRPFEYHNCIYHDMSPHEHYCITFSCNGNEQLFDLFFQRPRACNNLIVLSERKVDSLMKLLKNIISKKTLSDFESYYNFFKLIQIINDGFKSDETETQDLIPKELSLILDKINKNFTTVINIRQLAKDAHMSVNTLERYFKKYLMVTPSVYIKKKRLTYAANLLLKQHSVSSCAVLSGFSDTSQFIKEFKKQFGLTPFQYRKNITQSD